MKGKPATQVCFHVRKVRSGEIKDITITREKIHIPDIEYAALLDGTKTGYIRIGGFLQGIFPSGPGNDEAERKVYPCVHGFVRSCCRGCCGFRVCSILSAASRCCEAFWMKRRWKWPARRNRRRKRTAPSAPSTSAALSPATASPTRSPYRKKVQLCLPWNNSRATS